MILLTYLQRKTEILLSALISISDGWRLEMKEVVGRGRARARFGAV